MLAIEWLVNQLDSSSFERSHKPEICAVTGKLTWYPKRRGGYVWEGMAAPQSEWIDARLATVLENGYLRWQSWIVDRHGLRDKLKRADIRDLVLNQSAEPPWGAYAAEDMRRHGGLLTILNPAWDENAVIQFGASRTSVARTRECYEAIYPLYAAGFSRKDLTEPDRCGGKRIQQYGILKWIAFLDRWRERFGSPEWRLAVWLLPPRKQEKSEEESHGGSV